MKHTRKGRSYTYLSLILCFLLVLSVFLLFGVWRQAENPSKKESEWVYIYLSQDENTDREGTSSDTSSGRILRTHEGRIGIFHENGSLVEILDIQIKTLPKADQILLEEGIYAADQSTLHALIEDYSE